MESIIPNGIEAIKSVSFAKPKRRSPRQGKATCNSPVRIALDIESAHTPSQNVDIEILPPSFHSEPWINLIIRAYLPQTRTRAAIKSTRFNAPVTKAEYFP